MLSQSAKAADNAGMERSPIPSAAAPRVHLKHLDGLRGLAAFYIVLHHAFILNQVRPLGKPGLLTHLTNWLLYGHLAVAVFIVLSGYCLMLPIVQDPEGHIKGGILGFAKRRALRILPAYYGALAASLALIAYVPALDLKSDTRWDVALPVTPPVIVAHLLLYHNWSIDWLTKIDYPMWSIGTEIDIYVVFALLLLPIRRRFGIVAAILTAIALSLVPSLLCGRQFDFACPWYLALFAFGMAATHVKDASRPIITAAIAMLLVVWLGAEFYSDEFGLHQWILDFPTGIATALLLAWLAGEGRHSGLARLLSCRTLITLGSFSFSLYLTHAPLIALFRVVILPLHCRPLQTVALTELVAVPICVVAAYGFYRLFERPFLPGHPITQRAVGVATAISPAP